MAQETQIGALYQPRGVVRGGRWEGVSKERGCMYTYDWLMLRFERKQQNSVKNYTSLKHKLIKKIFQNWRRHKDTYVIKISVSSVQFSCSVVSDSLRPHGLQHARPSCPSPTPRVYPNSWPLCQWCHPTISSSVIPLSSRLQSFPASGSFPVSQLFAWGGQSIGVSASTSVLPVNTQDWSPLGWTSWISLQSKGLSRVFSNTTVQTHPFFCAQLSSQSNSHIHIWPLEKHSLD